MDLNQLLDFAKKNRGTRTEDHNSLDSLLFAEQRPKPITNEVAAAAIW